MTPRAIDIGIKMTLPELPFDPLTVKA